MVCLQAEIRLIYTVFLILIISDVGRDVQLFVGKAVIIKGETTLLILKASLSEEAR